MFIYNDLERFLKASNSLSRGAPSTTRPPLHTPLSKHFKRFGNPLNSRPMQFFVEQCINMSKLVGEKRGRDWGNCFHNVLFSQKNASVDNSLYIEAGNRLSIHDENKIFGPRPNSLENTPYFAG